MMKELCKKVSKIEPFWSFQNDESKIFFNHGEGMIDKYSIAYLRHDIFYSKTHEFNDFCATKQRKYYLVTDIP